MNKKFILLLIIFLVGLLGLSFYLGFIKNGSVNDSEDLKIAVSIFPLYDITKNIAGDKAEVVLMLPVGASEHTFEPTPKEQEQLSNADLVLLIGHGIDVWVEKLVPSGIGVDVVKVDKNIELKLLGAEEGIEEGGDGFDPHYFLSITNAMIIADNVADELSKEDPANSQYYKGNSYKYKTRLGQLKQELQQKIVSLSDPNIVTFHEAFVYFAEEFNIEIVASIEPFPGKEPTPQYLAEVKSIVEENEIKVLFKEPQLSDSVISALASDLGVTIYTLDPVGGMEGRDSYEKLIEYNVNTIIEALGPNAD